MPHDNNAVIDKAVDGFIKETIVPQAIEGFRITAEDILRQLEDSADSPNSSGLVPVYTANLLDSSGLAIYAMGQLIEFRPNPRATVPQEYKGREEIWGRDWYDYALSQAGQMFDDNNVYLVAFVGVPYGVEVDSTHNFFEDIKVEIIQQAFPNLKSTIDG